MRLNKHTATRAGSGLLALFLAGLLATNGFCSDGRIASTTIARCLDAEAARTVAGYRRDLASERKEIDYLKRRQAALASGRSRRTLASLASIATRLREMREREHWSGYFLSHLEGAPRCGH
jgi:hypothetical protein